MKPCTPALLVNIGKTLLMATAARWSSREQATIAAIGEMQNPQKAGKTIKVGRSWVRIQVPLRNFLTTDNLFHILAGALHLGNTKIPIQLTNRLYVMMVDLLEPMVKNNSYQNCCSQVQSSFELRMSRASAYEEQWLPWL